jgi:hypothetical protein
MQKTILKILLFAVIGFSIFFGLKFILKNDKTDLKIENTVDDNTSHEYYQNGFLKAKWVYKDKKLVGGTRYYENGNKNVYLRIKMVFQKVFLKNIMRMEI